MVNQFLQTIKKAMQSLGVTSDSRVLVGVSGGADSMVLLHALHELNYRLTAAHVNFKLRGAESEQDAVLVKTWCNEHAIHFLLLETDTRLYAEENKLNIQQAARQIRYAWWEELRESGSFDFIATAHQLDDNIETFLINMLRGTGIEGLTGIRSDGDHYIRPMLELTRSEVEEYALNFHVPFRTDSSNLKDDYQRNRIRHYLIPLMEKLAPGFSSRMQHNFLRIKKEWADFESSYHNWTRNHIQVEKNGFHILYQREYPSFLLKWLEAEGIPWNLAFDFISAPNENEGKVIHYHDMMLSRTEKGYFLQKALQPEIMEITGPGVYSFYNGELIILKESIIPTGWSTVASIEYISPSVVIFPLHVRHVEPGDAFQPLGMKGNRKKLQDLLVDKKLEMHEKANVRLLCNQDHIIWVVGIQLDERAKVTRTDPFVYKLEWKEK